MTKTLFLHGEKVSVLVPQPINGLLDYFVENDTVLTGQYVLVPFGKKEIVGIIWGSGTSDLATEKIRKIIRVIDIPPMSSNFREFLVRASDYTINTMNSLLRLTVTDQRVLECNTYRIMYSRGHGSPKRMTKLRRSILNFFDLSPSRLFELSEVQRQVAITKTSLASLVESKSIKISREKYYEQYPRLSPVFSKSLTDEQTNVSKILREKVRVKSYGTTLLRGVTGSGKTEVYLDCIAESIASGRQVLVLMPEISLSIEFFDRVRRRFNVSPAVWHSGIKIAEKRRVLAAVARNELQLVVGARSALFLPFFDLGLIVVDEEHDASYKQSEGVCYNARDMSVLRASLEKAQVILASATPSLESWTNAKNGKYDRLDLKERFGSANMPSLRAIDMKSEKLKKGRWISLTLEKNILKRLDAGEQALLFLNRRGYAPVTVCNSCGGQVECSKCDARLVYHRFLESLVCHQCGYKQSVPVICPKCSSKNSLAPIGPGVERLAEECKRLFPNSKVEVLSSDLIEDVGSLRNVLSRISTGQTDIVIGTQLVSKGHNFPLLTLVGVIDADIGLEGGDLRASEKCFQMIRQVVGRAGRDSKPGEALIQTWKSDHSIIRALLSNEDEKFMQAESELRSLAKVPPFGRMVSLIVSGISEKKLFEFGFKIARDLNLLCNQRVQIYGPAAAPISKVKNRYRIRLLLKFDKDTNIQKIIRNWRSNLKLPSSVRLTIDVDPHIFS